MTHPNGGGKRGFKKIMGRVVYSPKYFDGFGELFLKVVEVLSLLRLG